jgi:hypothetical protein
MRYSRFICLILAAIFPAGTLASSAATLIDVAFTGAAVTSKTGFAATGVTTSDFWNTCYESASNLLFVDGVTASGTGLTVANGASEYDNGASDPMYGVYLYAYVGNIVVTITNLAAGTYDFYVYGHGNQNVYAGVYQLSVDLQSYGTEETTNGPGWLSAVWQEGVQYVEFTNVIVAAGQTITINAEPAGALYYGTMAVISGLQMEYVSAAPSPAPAIVLQPESQTIVACSNATFGVFANGAAPLAYQWQFDTTNIPGATNISYSVENAQPTNDGNYSVIVSNAYGSVTSAPATLTVIGTPFITTQPTNETASPGSTAAFSVSAGGATPLQYIWQVNGASIAGATNSSYTVVNAQFSNSGNYSVIVTNAYGVITSGVAAFNVIIPVASVIDVAFGTSSPAPKTGFAATGVTVDDFWNAYVATTEGLPALEFMDGTMSGASLEVENATDSYSNGSSDPMYGGYLYSGGIFVNIYNLMGGMYDLYLYGHGNVDVQNGIYDLTAGSMDYGTEATTNGPGWLSGVWQEGVQYVEFTNVDVPSGQTVTIAVEPGATGYALISGLQIVPVGSRSPNAYLVTGPADQLVGQGSNATFSASATGAAPLFFQWLFDSFIIPGATNSSYTVTNATVASMGDYSVIVSNSYSTVTSAVATLTVFEPVGALINVAFAYSVATGKRGYAAAGVSTNDYWNTFSSLENTGPWGALPNLTFANGIASQVGLTNFIIDYPAATTNGASDPMYGVCIYPSFEAGGINLGITNLAAGVYNIYLYGHGPADNENSIFQLTVGSVNYGSQATTTNSSWIRPAWHIGVQYVEFTNVIVAAGQTVSIAVSAENSMPYPYPFLSGLQIAYVGSPIIVQQPAAPTVVSGSVASLDVEAIGATPLSYQWLYDNTVISGATDSSYSISNVQTNNSGSYSVIVTNGVGSATSAAALLTVIQIQDASPPFIITQPTSQAANQGSSAIFTALAEGPAPLAYQWMFNGVAIPEATNSTLVVSNVQPANAGDFSLNVSNANGTDTSTVATLSVLQPVAKLIDVAFTAASVTGKWGFAAIGVTSNDFWNTSVTGTEVLPNLQFVDGTPSGAGLAVTNAGEFYANGASDPMYGVYVSPYSGDITLTITNLTSGTYDFYLYGHGSVDIDNSTFYLMAGQQSYGSEATINGSGWLSAIWQEGVQFVEFSNVIVAAEQPISITVGQGAGGSIALSGMQMAFLNPPSSNAFIVCQPANQVAAFNSTATFSVLAGGATPLSFQWQFNDTNVPGATNSSYSVIHAQQGNSGNYSVIVSNAYGSVTSVLVMLTVNEPIVALIDVAFTTAPSTAKTGFAAVGLNTNDFWNTFTQNNQTLKFADGVTSDMELSVSNNADTFYEYGNGAADPMYGLYVYPAPPGGGFTVTVTNLIAGTYDFYCYGHGNEDNQNGVYQLTVGSRSYGSEATTTNAGWLSPVWQEGMQYVEFTNVSVSNGQTITVTVEPGASEYAVLSGLQMACLGAPSPVIVEQPENQSVVQGVTGTFSVEAGGAEPLEYQWLFNSVKVPGATNSIYSVTIAQAVNAGNYRVIVTNAYGSVTSAVALLTVQPMPMMIDVAFTGGSVTAKTGFAATGVATNDFWNTYVMNSGALANLKVVDGTLSATGLTAGYFDGSYDNGASDPMYGGYIFYVGTPGPAVTVTNLIVGTYDFYLYGHGNEDNQNGIFQLTVGSQSYGNEATTSGSGWLSSVWQEGVQYVEFTNVSVADGQAITITMEPDTSFYCIISGLQIAAAGPPLITQAPSQFVNVNRGVILTNLAYSANGPISFSLASNAPAGARISTNGVFRWSPTCAEGSTTNLITVWATDSGTPPQSNSMTFMVNVSECVEISIGSSVQQTGQSTCVPVNLFSTIGLTNLNFTLSDPTGHFTNWNITPTNSMISSATAQMVDPLHALFNLGVQNGKALQGSNGLGSICLDLLPGPSAFVPLVPTNLGAAVSGGSSITNFFVQNGRVVVIGNQSLLEGWLDTNYNRMLTVYGNPGVSYEILTTTNLADPNSWSAIGDVPLTNLFQFISLEGETNPVQFFQVVQP